MEELKGETRAPLTLDWDRLLPSRDGGGGGGDDDNDDELFVATTVESWHEKHYPKTTQPEPSSTASLPRQPPSQGDDDHEIKMMSDHDLNYDINRKRQHLNNLAHKLPDKGARLMARIDQLEAEKERRRQRRLNPNCQVIFDCCIFKHYPKTTQSEPSSTGSPPRQPPLQGDDDHKIKMMSDQDLNYDINRRRQQLNNLAHKLPDKGARIMALIDQLEAEKERRRQRRLNPTTQSESSSTGSPPRQPPLQGDDDHKIKMMSDQDLNYDINRRRQHLINLAHKLPDKGARIMALIDQLEAEKERRRQRRLNPTTQSEPSSTVSLPRQPPLQGDGDREIKMMSDQDLNYDINRKRQHLNNLAHKLPDKGARIMARIDQLEAEKERRRQRQLNPDANGCEMLSQSENPRIIGSSNESQKKYPVPKNNPQPSFCTLFSGFIEQNNEGSRIVNSFDKDLSHLGQCGHSRTGLKGDSSQKRRRRSRISSRSNAFRSPTTLSSATDKRMRLNGDHRGASCLSYRRDKLTSSLTKRIEAEVHSSHDSRLKKKLVLVDEEEPQFGETTQAAEEKFILVDEEPHLVETIQEADELSQCMTGKKIYYPSRDDPESVEICYEDIKCLEPEAYLSSTIMNYYIRYLQQLASPTDEAWCDYHIFNTYFYRKLQEAVSNKSDKEIFFAKFRRWWKGVNIFQKAYILIPVHENLHWSLVIISIPDKDDESGPIILHMDSLRLHCSKSIFSNIKSYLSDEWSYLSQKLAPPDVPIAERIWMQLPSRIVEKIIPVPQQKNEYDCGLFVLLFMELFIKGAPQRLKSNGLEMFGRHWFKPEQASRLRGKIRELITEEFKIASL